MLVHLLQHHAVDYIVMVVIVAYQLDIQVGRPSIPLSLVDTLVLLVALGLEYAYPEVAQQTHVVVVVVAAVVVVVDVVIVVVVAAAAEGDIAPEDGIAV